MSGLRNLVDKLKPTFSEGGNSRSSSTFDAFERFFRTEHHDAEGCAHP